MKAGFTEESAKAYLNGLKESLGNPNFASDLRIPGAAQYTSVILDREVARFLAGEIDAAADYEQYRRSLGRSHRRLWP